jgi:nitric oxide reductase large subunit
VFAPAVLSLIIALIFSWKLYEMPKRENRKGFRQLLILTLSLWGIALIYCSLFYIGRLDPRAWGGGQSVGCYFYGC